MDLYSLFSILSDAERAQIMAMLDNATHQRIEQTKKAGQILGARVLLPGAFDISAHLDDLSEFARQIQTPSRFSIPEPEDYKEPGT